MAKIKVGVSACLLGENVRYDGEPKLNPWVRDTLGQRVDFVPVCPEVGLGMPVPRPPIRLVGQGDRPRLIQPSSGDDLTLEMERWAQAKCDELEAEGLSGFIFKSRSPSCGVGGVKLYDGAGVPSPLGTGIFARIFMERFPSAPVVVDDQLDDAAARERFSREVVGGAERSGGSRP